MNSRKKAVLILLMVLAIAVITAVAAIRTQDQDTPVSKEQQRLDFINQFPIADYAASLPPNPEERAKRQSKSRKYDKSIISVNEQDQIVSSAIHWASGLSAIPVDDSDAVVVGEITDAQAFLSNDKTGIYSEFNFRISEILKNDLLTPLTLESVITLERPGGRVKFPSGHISTYFTAGMGMPRVKRQYVFFLKHETEDGNFLILTGYELRGGHVTLLDNPGEGHPISVNKDKDAASFLNNIRESITTSSSNISPK